MKVFISWSGNKSHRVGLIFREWLPSVIQSIEPYVSSEDIDKGARWSTDIAKELENSTFGILCVTKENLHAPWLSFEAGALSKTMDKSFVTPFLFDIKRSEVNGPILQFQSTIFEKDDIKKLLQTLNKACGENGITEIMLDKAFEVWYPTLSKELNALHDMDEASIEDIHSEAEIQSSAIMEEILELSRDNQKLLRNPDTKIVESIEDIRQRIDIILSRVDRTVTDRRITRRNSMIFLDELLHGILPTCQKQYALLIVLNLFQNDFPWIYNMGKGLVDLIQSQTSASQKLEAINDFKRLLDFTYEHPMMRESYNRKREVSMIQRDMNMMFRDALFNLLRDIENEISS
ncbi:MAG: toll/interleukin-1 receptor domain-containing protein [Firmicutes bacterium]|nr:toll/interleukin-1 receptor domain-containing protein [Bacillota bacterium]